MKMRKTCSIVLLLVVSSLPLRAQILPAMAYGGLDDERAFALAEATSQDGYVLAGWTKSFGIATPAFSNVLIVKTDSFAIPQWARVSIGIFDDEAHSMTPTSDGGYAITGWTRSFGPYFPDSTNIFVVKIDSAGLWQWGFVYGSPFCEEAYSIIQTVDGGYAVTGWTNLFAGMPPTIPPNIFLLKLDPVGNIMWTWLYWFGMNLEDEGYSIAEIPTAGATSRYLIAGRAKVFNPVHFDAFVLQTDPAGVPVSLASVVPGQFEDEAYSVLWGGTSFLAAGWSNSHSNGTEADIIVWQDDTAAGPPMSAYHFGWSNDEKVMDDRSLNGISGHWQVSGWTQSAGPGIPNPNFLIIGYDTSGFSGRVHPSAPGANTEQAYPMISTTVADARYAIAGFTNSFGQGGDDFHLLTLDWGLTRPECVIDSLPPFDSIQILQEDFLGEPSQFGRFEDFPLEDTMVMYTEICTLQTGVMEIPTESYKTELNVYTSFEYVTVQIGRQGWLRAYLFDVTGREVATLAESMFEKGTHMLVLPKNIGAGVYYVRVDFDGVVKSAKVLRYR